MEKNEKSLMKLLGEEGAGTQRGDAKMQSLCSLSRRCGRDSDRVLSLLPLWRCLELLHFGHPQATSNDITESRQISAVKLWRQGPTQKSYFPSLDLAAERLEAALLSAHTRRISTQLMLIAREVKQLLRQCS